MKRTAVLLGFIALAAFTAAAADSSSGLPAKVGSSQSYCPATPKTARVGQTPVWVLLEVRTKGGSLVKDVAFTVRRYTTGRKYVEAGWAYSGCWSVLLYGHNRVPDSLCITVRRPYTAPAGPCQKVRSGPTSQKEVRFLLTS